MTYEKNGLEVVCNYTMPMVGGCNETDKELAKHRAEADDCGYDASVNFQVFISDRCLDFDFNLYGLDVRYTFDKRDTKITRKQVYDTIEIVNEWFEDKHLDDISEKMYHEIEEVLGKKIYEHLKETCDEWS